MKSQRPPPSLVDFTGRLLRYEVDRDLRGTRDFAAGFQRVCRALHSRLAPLISSTGFHTLFARAMKLASRDFPILQSMSISSDWSVCGMPGAADADTEEQMLTALGAILAHFIWLLITFIGGNLGLGTVCEMWPEVPFDRLDSDSGVDP